MKTVSAAFTSAETRTTREPKIKVLMQLRNIAAQAEGGVISAASTAFSTDYPKEGANNGDTTHLNYGPASTAEDTIGLSGYKSDSAASSKTITAVADWTGGTQTNVIDVGDAVEQSFTTSRYEQDFDGLTAAPSNLEGQDSWTRISGTSSIIQVNTAATYQAGGKGVKLLGAGAASSCYETRAVTFGAAPIFSYRIKCNASGGNTSDYLSFQITNNATSTYFGLRFFYVSATQVNPKVIYSGGTFANNDINYLMTVGNWYRVTVKLSALGAGSTMDIWISDGTTNRHIVSLGGLDTSSQTKLFLQLSQNSTTAPNYYIDEIRVGDAFNATGTQENVLDFTTAPVDGIATLTATGESSVSARQVAGCVIADSLGNNNNGVRNATTVNRIGQTFQATESVPITSIVLGVAKVASPVGNMYVNIYAVDGSNYPTGNPLATSTIKPVADLTTTVTATEFTFPVPFIPTTGDVFAWVIMADDVAISGTNYLSIRSKTGGSVYASGRYIYLDGSTWKETTTIDLIFAMYSNVDVEAYYGLTSSDTAVALCSGASDFYISQGFKVPYSMDFKHAALTIAKDAGGTALNAADRIWWELQSDDGTGKPSNVMLLRSQSFNPANLVTWASANHRYWVLSAPTSYPLVAGTQYHLVLKGNTKVVAMGTDSHIMWYAVGAGGGYADGYACVSTNDSTPVWTVVDGRTQSFKIFGATAPFIEWDVAYSTDNITYGSYVNLTDNPSRSGSLSATAFTGETKRYWKVKASLITKPANWTYTHYFTPQLADYTVKAIWHTAKTMTLDLGSDQTFSQISIWNHPTEKGMTKFNLALRASAGGAVTLTPDITICESHALNASATITNPSGTDFVQTGDYAVVRFADATARYVDLTINQNTYDEYARVLEIQVHRVVDISSQAVLGVPQNRLASFVENRDADSVLRKVKARTLTMTLINTDGYLSSENTSGPYYGMLGAGCVFIPYVGFQDVTDMSRMGTFYVDEWTESASSNIVSISLRDRVKYMSKDVLVQAKTGYRHGDIIRYLGNLAGISSQEMSIDITSGTVDQFPENQVNAYEEAQKVAEACGYSALYFDDNGTLTFRSLGLTIGETKVGDIANIIKSWGPAQQVGTKLWIAVTVTNGGNEDLKLYYRTIGVDTSWSAWSGGVISTKGATHSALLTNFNGNIYVLDFDADTGAAATINADLWKCDITANTITKVARFFNQTNYPGCAWNPWPATEQFENQWLLGGPRFTTFAGAFDKSPVKIDLLTGISTVITGVAGYQIGDLLTDGSNIYATVDGGGLIYIYEIDPASITTYASHDCGISVSAGNGYTLGATLDGTGYLLVHYTQILLALSYYSPRMWTIKISDWSYTISTIGTAQEACSLGEYTSDALVSYGGKTLSAWVQTDGTNFNLRNLYKDSTWTTDYNDIGSVGSASSLSQFVIGTYGTKVFAFGRMALGEMFEYAFPSSNFNQSSAVLTIGSAGAFGEFMEAQLIAGDDQDGNSSIINATIITSTPAVPDAATTVIATKSIPYGYELAWKTAVPAVSRSCYVEYTCSYPSTPVDASTLVMTPSSVLGGGATITTTLRAYGQTWSRWRFQGTVGAGNSYAYLTGYSLAAKITHPIQKLISVNVGAGKSINRYGLRQLDLENNYIYSTISQGLIGSDIVARYQYRRPRIRGLKTRARWELEIFDRITVTEPTYIFVNQDYYCVRIRRDYLAQTMELEVAG